MSSLLRRLPGGGRGAAAGDARRHRHADLLPGAPVDRHRARAAGQRHVGCQRVEEIVGRGVVDLAEPTGYRDGRRAEDHEVERQPGAGGQQGAGALHLRCNHPRRRLGRAELDHAAAGEAGGVDHAVELTEAVHRRFDHGAHLRAVGDVGADHHHLRAERLDLPDLADPQTDAVPLAVRRQPLVPGGALGERRNAEQHQARPVLAGQELGEGEAEAAEAAGDQVDAPLAQPDPVRHRRRQAHGLVVLRPAAPAAVRHHRPRRLGGRLGDQPPGHRTDRSGRSGGGPGDVDADAAQPRELLRDGLQRSQQHRPLGHQPLLAGDPLHVGGGDGEVEPLGDAVPGQRLGEVEQAPEAALRYPRQRLRIVGERPGVPQVQDAVGQSAGGGEVLDQGVIVLAAGWVDLVALFPVGALAGLAEAVAGPHHRHPPPVAAQPRHHLLAQLPIIEEDQPAAGALHFLGRRHRRERRLPVGEIEPVGDVRLLVTLLRARAERSDPRAELDPVAPALEGVGRQRHAPPPLVRVEAAPVRLDAVEPELSQRLEQEGQVLLALLRVAQRGENHVAGAAVGVLAGEGRQGLSRPHLQEHPLRVAAELAHAVGEAHRLAQVARPVGGIGRLGVGDPGAGDVRDVGDLRRLQHDPLEACDERLQDRLHHHRVKGVRGVERPRADAGAGELSAQRLHRRVRAGDHAAVRGVDGGQRQLGPQPGRQLLLGQRHRQHRPRWQALHQPAALGHQGERGVEREDAGQAGRHVLADAVPHHRGRPHPPLHPQAGERVLDHEQRRLGVAGLAQPLGGRRAVVGREQQLPQVEAEVGVEALAAEVDRGVEGRLRLIEAAPHADVLRALAGEQEGGRALASGRVGGDAPLGLGGAEHLGGVRGVAADHHPPVLVQLAPDLQRVGGIGERALRMHRQVGGEARRQGGERGFGARREEQELPWAGGRARRRLRRLFEDRVGVGAPHAEGAHAGAARRAVGLPLAQPGVDEEGAGGEVDLRVRHLEQKRRRDHPVLERQHRLDQAGDAGRGAEVADVGLHRAQGAELPLLGLLAEGLGQRRHLDRVPHRRAGAVGLDVGHRPGVDLGGGQRGADHPVLTVDAGRREAHLLGAVVGHRRPLDHRMDRVAVGQSVGQTLEHHDAEAGAEDRPLSLGVESADAAVRRVDIARPVGVADLGDAHGDAPGERHVALAGEQPLAGHVDGYQRRRAGRLDGDARPPQVQLVGDPGRQVVLFVGDLRRQVAHGAHQRRVRIDVHQIEVQPRAGIDADPSGIALGVVAGVLQGRPTGFEEQPVLGVHHVGFARIDAEERGVELIDVPDRPGDLDVRRRPPLGGRHLLQLLVAEHGQRLDPVAQVGPEIFQALGARETAGHPDDRDLQAVAARALGCAHILLLTLVVLLVPVLAHGRVPTASAAGAGAGGPAPGAIAPCGRRPVQRRRRRASPPDAWRGNGRSGD